MPDLKYAKILQDIVKNGLHCFNIFPGHSFKIKNIQVIEKAALSVFSTKHD